MQLWRTCQLSSSSSMRLACLPSRRRPCGGRGATLLRLLRRMMALSPGRQLLHGHLNGKLSSLAAILERQDVRPQRLH